MKTRVGIIFGGKSTEHEVSLQSAKNIIEAIDKQKYEVVLIGVTKQGEWLSYQAADFLLNAQDPQHIALNQHGKELVIYPSLVEESNRALGSDTVGSLDVIFPIIHGTLGEDGSLQGMLRMLDLPFVGSGVLGSAVSMDKDITKRLLRDAGLKVAPFVTLTPSALSTLDPQQLIEQLGLPLFVKPANQGSSVGVSKVKNAQDLLPALQEAFRYDNKVLIESAIVGREIECAVLGNQNPIASCCGEVVLEDEFYSYQTKYVSAQGARVQIPAQISPEADAEIRSIALKTFNILGCSGMARVDVFLTSDQQVIINEVNTLPGFTNISMYPKLWQASGIDYPQLISQLISLAIEAHQQQKTLLANLTK